MIHWKEPGERKKRERDSEKDPERLENTDRRRAAA